MPDHLTPSERALREAAEKATAGTWRTHPTDDTRVTADGGDGEVAQALGDYQHDWRRMEATATYIVAAQPSAVLALLDEIERLREGLKLAALRLRLLTDRMHGCHAETGKHELLDEAEAFCVEARAALAPKEKNDG